MCNKQKRIPLFTGWQSWPLTLITLLYSLVPSLSPTQPHNSSHTVTASEEIRCNAGFTHYTIVHSAGDRDSGAQRAKRKKKKKEDKKRRLTPHTHTHNLSLYHTFTTHKPLCVTLTLCRSSNSVCSGYTTHTNTAPKCNVQVLCDANSHSFTLSLWMLGNNPGAFQWWVSQSARLQSHGEQKCWHSVKTQPGQDWSPTRTM